MGKTLRRNSLMQVEKVKKVKVPHTFWKVQWRTPHQDCPTHWSRAGEWIFDDHAAAVQAIRWYQMYYQEVTDPQPISYRRQQRQRFNRNRDRSQDQRERDGGYDLFTDYND